ncbi:uncharacterized protein AMSG_03258 [Thecamonas trahens ATCC 50062]|uniref:Uncharacterized protein n=1 Tax=Thecamonas trahens ATCC 50062 TaxID=461836 RepID=A0A0L0D3B1_THETB|nr:hypothetical protein AMSG_03258 [Thecamonas trahens ATCC 50062]KNC46827.1 hypothetical protein AMSG_03258 [Thecamonas trahens ATCC 50062]|eukprot:XP_013760102.1 hypothetical protein AMSG_03258 [Thecamonas trahens ATCC 50062]
MSQQSKAPDRIRMSAAARYVATTNDLESDLLVSARRGDVLTPSMVLKSDAYPGSRAWGLTPRVSGAPNFRRAYQFPLFGVAQPTAAGMRAVLRLAAARSGIIHWVNLREEAMIYLNMTPYVLRSADDPLANLQNLRGISAERLDALEAKLKADVVAEARRYGSMILVHKEVEPGRVLAMWEHVELPSPDADVLGAVTGPTSILTSAEFVAVVLAQVPGISLSYHRIPLPPMAVPDFAVFDALARVIEAASDAPGAAQALVFNCQSGRGRTTFSMALAKVILKLRAGVGLATPVEMTPKSSYAPELASFGALGDSPPGTPSLASRLKTSVSLTGGMAALAVGPCSPTAAGEQGEDLAFGAVPKRLLGAGLVRSPSLDSALPESTHPVAVPHDRIFGRVVEQQAGNYRVVLALVRALAIGARAKTFVDDVVDTTAELVNIREAVLVYKASSPPDLEHSLLFLRRYVMLIAFSAYYMELVETLSAGGTFPRQISFADWINEHPEVRHVYSSLDTDSVAAFFVPADDLDADSRALAASLEAGSEVDPKLARSLVAGRSGSVLSAYSILRQDVVDVGVTAARPGAPPLNVDANYRPLLADGEGRVGRSSFQIHGCAQTSQPTLRSLLRSVLVATHAGRINVVNVRMEPFVYISGVPFALRSFDAPRQVLMEMRGISAERLLEVEARLKADVADEAASLGNKVLVHPGESVALADLLPDGTSLVTPAEAMAQLLAEGFKLSYERLPLHVGTLAGEDEEALASLEAQAKLSALSTSTIASVLAGQINYTARSFDDLAIEAVAARNAGEHLLLISGHGGMRTAVCMAVAGLAAGIEPVELVRPPVAKGAPQPKFANPQLVKELVRLLPHGNAALERAEEFFAAAAGRSLRSIMWSFLDELSEGDDEDNTATLLRFKARYSMDLYLNLICFTEYAAFSGTRERTSFAGFLNSLPEVSGLLSALWSSARREGDDVLFSRSDFENRAKVVPSCRTGVVSSMDDHAGVVDARGGTVLAGGMIMKADHFPGCQKQHIELKLTGAPNFRHVDARYPIYGVGMPTGAALVEVLLRVVGEAGASARVHWVCLREEPVLFLAAKPFVLREAGNPFRNLQSRGIDEARLEALELRLLDDVRAEAELYGAHVLVHGEDETGDPELMGMLLSHWEAVEGPHTIATYRDLFASLEEFSVDFFRVPVTDEKAFLASDLERVAGIVADAWGCDGLPETIPADRDALRFVCQCQMGQGRTTQGTVVCHMVIRALAGEADAAHLDAASGDESDEDDRSRHNLAQPLRPLRRHSSVEAMRAGEYATVLDLVRVLGPGWAAKDFVDTSIDACDLVLNLRTSIHDVYLLSETNPRYVGKTLDFLERYCVFVVFAAYLLEAGATFWHGPDSQPFTRWLADRPEVVALLQNPRL